MPGTIGTFRLAVGTDVKVLDCHDGTVFVLVDNDGTDPFGGRYVICESGQDKHREQQGNGVGTATAAPGAGKRVPEFAD